MKYYNFKSEGYNINDEVFAVVTSCCNRGIFVNLENGETAFAHFTKLPKDTKVLCSIRKEARDNRCILVSVDSVCDSIIAA